MTSASIDRRFGLTGNKAYKAPCDVATTGNITLSGEQTIDGVLTSESDVLVWQQSNPVDNGIWVSSTGSWTRRADANTNQDLGKGTQVYVSGGTAYAGNRFAITANDPINPGTTSITIVQTTDSSTLEARLASTASAADGDARVGVQSTRPNTEATTQHAVNERHRNIFDWLTDDLRTLVKARTGYDAPTRSAMYTRLSTAWLDAIDQQFDLLFPDGLYEIGAANFPFKNPSNTSLLDCKNISLLCSPGVEFRTASTDGADILQLNALKNFHVRGFPKLTATISGSVAGSNGVSITNGWDNITVEIYAENLPSLDKTSYVDGGKALTIQPSTTSNECGTLVGRVRAKGCSEGFGYEPDLVTALTKKTAIDVHVMAEDCFYAVKMGSGAASSALSANQTSGARVVAHAINCQKDLVLDRVHGGDFDVHVVTTKTAAARRLNPVGVTWFAADSTVEALLCKNVHTGHVKVDGNKGGCDYKARIGATTAGSSGLTGATYDTSLELDIGGTAGTADVAAIDSGGNTLSNSLLHCSLRTATSLPTALYAASLLNTLSIGQALRLPTPKVSGAASLAQGSDGTTESGQINLSGAVTRLQGKGTSSANAVIAGLADSAGTLRFGIINGGGIVIDALGSSSALGAYIGKHPVYNSSGAFIGYFPVYA